MTENDSDDLEIIDSENYMGGKNQSFSHQSLIMKAMMKCIELGDKEMHEGIFDKQITREGGVKLIYKENTRKAFIESVKTLLMVAACDLDDEAKEKIGEIQQQMEDLYKELLEKQIKAKSTPGMINQIIKKKIFIDDTRLSPLMPFLQEYQDEEVDLYRAIFGELSKLTLRLNFYEEAMYTG